MKKVYARDEKGFNCDGKRKKYTGGARKTYVWPIKTNGSSSNIPISFTTPATCRPRAKVSAATLLPEA